MAVFSSRMAGAGASSGSGSPGDGASSTDVARLMSRAFLPEAYGGLGNDPTKDDAPGLQAALNAASVANGGVGGVVSLDPNRTYYPRSKLSFDPSRTLLEGNGARIDFRGKSFTDPALSPELVGNYSFDTDGSGWTVTANSNRQPVFTGGEMRFEAPADTYSFLEMGRQITAPAGSKLRVVVEVGKIDTITVGANTYRSITVGFRAGNLATGGVSGKSKVISNQDGAYKPGAFIQYDVGILTANPFLRIQTSANVIIRSISVKVLPDNTCILIQVPSTGRLRGHNERAIQNLKIAGRSDQSLFVDLFEFETPTESFASRVNFYNVDGSEGVGRALLFGNRAYLMNFHSCRFTAALACVETLENPDDAGENIAFIGGNLGAGQCGIRNRGMAIRLFGTSIDFSRQFYVGTGSFEAHGGWFETNQHTTDDAAVAGFSETQYRFDVQGGTVKLYGGLIQVDGSTTPQAEAIFRIAKNATVDMIATDVYNMRTTSGAWAVGEGRIKSMIRGGTGKETEAVLSRASLNNRILGDLDNQPVIVNAWLTSTSKQKQPDRRTIQWFANKAFTGTLTRGSAQINTTDTSGLVVGFTIEGDGVVPGSSIVSINAGASITLSNPVGGNGSKALVGYGAAAYATAAMTADDQVFHTGGRSLKVQKTGIGSTSLVAYVAVPVERGHAAGGEAWLKVPGGLSGLQTLFFDTYFAALAQGDSSDAPIVSATRQAITNQNIVLDLAAGLDWTRVSWKTTRVDATAAHDGYAPEWATHIVLAFNMASMPNGFTMYLDDIVASSF